MAKPEDAVVPILRKIQSKLAEMETTFSASLQRVESKVDGVAMRMDDIEDYFTYTMGLTTQNKADIAKVSKQFRKEVKELRDRLEELERQT